EVEKKKPQLGDFDVNSAPASFIEARISPFAQKKLEKREYCPLWPFTTGGLNEAAAALISSTDDGTHKNMVRDENLSYREFSLRWHRYIKEIIRANWPKLHVNALAQFFYGLDTHSLHEQEHGDK
ncbi:hypothetical protein B0H10DRAFT_1711142, partial [Mycena sp. CBHHK59/15]